MKRRNKKTATTLVVAIATAITGAISATSVVHATDEYLTTTEVTTTTETTATTSSEVTTEANEPKVGDRIWINEEKMVFWDVDKSFKAEVTSKIQFEIFIISRYDEDRWRVHVPFENEPERVLLIPVDYNITVIEHDGRMVGDLNYDGTINVYDMILMRQALFRDYDLDNYSDIDALEARSWDRQVADINSDKKISVADLVSMQNFLTGNSKSF